MRNTIKYMISSVALAAVALSFGTAALAQSDVKPVNYDKTISGPNADGVYTINLEAYVTGSVTVETESVPADIVLVLDYSTSMNDDISGNSISNNAYQNRRISLLRKAVADFVKTVQTNNSSLEESSKDEYGGHRIAFVLFSTNVYTTNAGLNTFINAENLTTTEESGSGRNYVSATVKSGNYNILGSSSGGSTTAPTPSTGTNSNVAMEKALEILNDQDYTTKAPKRSRVVVFFTDGAPGGQESTNWYTSTSRIAVADGCIDASYTIKTKEWNQSPTTVYAVGMFSSATTATAASTYLSYTSSDYPKRDSEGNIISGQEGNEMPKLSNGQGDPNKFITVSGDKSVIVTTQSALDNVFSSIASASTPDATAASSSSVMVDIVASNFQIPENTALGSVKVYQVACTQASAASIISFSNDKEDITNVVTLVTDKTNGEVSVTGFDYGENWCGWDGSANNNTGAAHGYKLVLEIPITVKDDVVGGPSVDTNAEGSKLIIKDADGEEVASYNFTSPVVRIPVAIWIQKEGLNNNDSAIFTLRKTKFLGRYETDENEDIITDENGEPKRIDYTYVKGQTRSYTVKGVVTVMKWETFTKLAVNKKYNSDGIVKISGLDPDYVYRIEEDAWAHLGYDFDPDATARYTMEWDSATNSYKDVQNPFVFTNTSKGNVYAEDVIRNEFGQGSGTGGGLTTNE